MIGSAWKAYLTWISTLIYWDFAYQDYRYKYFKKNNHSYGILKS